MNEEEESEKDEENEEKEQISRSRMSQKRVIGFRMDSAPCTGKGESSCIKLCM